MRLLRIAPPHIVLTLVMTAVVWGFVLAVSESGARKVQAARGQIMQVRAALTQLSVARAAIAQVESIERGYLLTGNPRELQDYDHAVGQAQNAISELAGLSGDQLEWRARIESLRAHVVRKIDETKFATMLARDGHAEQAIDTLRASGDAVPMRAITQRMDELETELGAEIRRRQAVLDDHLQQQRLALAAVTAIGLACLVTVALLMLRQFREREEHRSGLQQLADHLDVAVRERTEELSSLSTHLQVSSEREKAQLARDLHDELGGILTSAKIDIAWLEGHSKAADPDVVPRLKRLATVLDEAVDLKRRVVENLRPSLLDHLGLGAALEWHVNETCRKAGLNSELRIRLDDGEAVPPDMAIAIYRLVQEGLVNVVNHAKASSVEVSLERVPGGYRLRLADNGVGIVGFRPEAMSHGLAGMRHRALALGGRFDLATAPGGGTRIEAWFPVAPASASAPERISSV